MKVVGRMVNNMAQEIILMLMANRGKEYGRMERSYNGLEFRMKTIWMNRKIVHLAVQKRILL